jgi:hypothetical protein
MPLQRKTSKRKTSRRKTRRRQHKNLFRRKRKNITYSLKGGGFMSRLNSWSQSQKQTPPPQKQEQTPPPQKQEQKQEQTQEQTLPPQKQNVGRGMTHPDNSFSPYDTEQPEQTKSWFDW